MINFGKNFFKNTKIKYYVYETNNFFEKIVVIMSFKI